jgi:predicted HD phosphohydrolase
VLIADAVAHERSGARAAVLGADRLFRRRLVDRFERARDGTRHSCPSASKIQMIGLDRRGGCHVTAAWTSDFRQMDDATGEEITTIFAAANEAMSAALVPNVLAQLEALKGPTFGYRVDRYEHSLQAATRATRDGASDDLVMAALLHDIGDHLSPSNHAELAATVLEPYLDEEAVWVVRHHTVFQMYHWGRHIGADVDARERYRGSPWFDSCARFCAEWDQASFDDAYDTLPLDAFLPTVEAVFARPAKPAAAPPPPPPPPSSNGR